MEDHSKESIKDIYNLRFAKSSKGKDILIQNEKYKFFCHNVNDKSNKIKWRCCEYKNISLENLGRCKAYFTTNINKDFLEDFIPEHNGHQIYEVEIEDNDTINTIYNKIENISNKYNINAKKLLDEVKK